MRAQSTKPQRSTVSTRREYYRVWKRQRQKKIRQKLADKILKWLAKRNGQAEMWQVAEAMQLDAKSIGRVVKPEYGLTRIKTTAAGNRWVHWVMTEDWE